MSKYNEAKTIAIAGLEKALLAHEAGKWLDVEDSLDEYEVTIPRNEIPSNTLLYLTLEFWSAWADSANHEHWGFYPPLGKSDYPRLAKVILSNLRSNTEITDEEIITNFSICPSKSIFSKLKGVFKKT